jgi:hypothetical protein
MKMRIHPPTFHNQSFTLKLNMGFNSKNILHAKIANIIQNLDYIK